MADADPLLRQLSPINLFTTVLWGEARGEPIEGQVGVANVILNRLNTGKWSHDIRAVILAPAQFSCLWPTGGEYDGVLAFARVCYNLTNLTRAEQQLRLLAEGALRPALLDNTLGATHYHDARMKEAPAWTVGATKTVLLGHHFFYKDVK